MSGTVRIVYWQDRDGMWLGFLEEYPDYMTQGETLDDLQEHLRDIYSDITGGLVPMARHHTEMAV